MPSFSAKVLKVIDKKVLSHTSGTSSTTTTSNRGFLSNQTTATATNTIKTDHIQNLTFEDEESEDIKRCKFVNQEFETPVGKNTAIFL